MCKICGSSESEPHFGGISCRACAAFFRRFYHSKKLGLKCTCKTRQSNAHPCRSCRIRKCYEAGMTPEKIQLTRDKHLNRTIKLEGPCSSLDTPITSRQTPNLYCVLSNWHELKMTRDEMNSGSLNNCNIFELTSFVLRDLELTWRMVSKAFPTVEVLEDRDKQALLRNFVPKLWQIEPILEYRECAEKFDNLEEEDYENLLVGFYGGTFPEGKEMSKSEIVSNFRPYWDYYYTKMILPISLMGLEELEYMAIVWLAFFDNGYSNISDNCLEMCRDIQNVILKELRNYQIDRNFHENRFFVALEALQIIERGEKKFMEEMLVCEMNHIRIHDDFRRIIREPKL